MSKSQTDEEGRCPESESEVDCDEEENSSCQVRVYPRMGGTIPESESEPGPEPGSSKPGRISWRMSGKSGTPCTLGLASGSAFALKRRGRIVSNRLIIELCV